MKNVHQAQLYAALFIMSVLASTISCDTPQTIAWSYYYCAKDTLEAGDPYAARHFLKACKKSVNQDLTNKVDSLMEVINRTIEERRIK